VAIKVTACIVNEHDKDESSNHSDDMPLAALHIPLPLLLMRLQQKQIIGTMVVLLRVYGCFLDTVIAHPVVLLVRNIDETKKPHFG
jgi:hypothetical protein